MKSQQSASQVETELRAIERRVFEEVWIGARRTGALTALTVVLAAAAVASQATNRPAVATHSGHWISLVAMVLFALATSLSAFALIRRRFRWCCLAACISALATIDGAGAFWWHHTAQTASLPPAAAAGTLAGAALTAGWLGVCLTPLPSSQPDMRAATRRDDSVSRESPYGWG